MLCNDIRKLLISFKHCLLTLSMTCLAVHSICHMINCLHTLMNTQNSKKSLNCFTNVTINRLYNHIVIILMIILYQHQSSHHIPAVQRSESIQKDSNTRTYHAFIANKSLVPFPSNFNIIEELNCWCCN